MAASAILNIKNSIILDPVDLRMANIYRHTILDAHIFIDGRDATENPTIQIKDGGCRHLGF